MNIADLRIGDTVGLQYDLGRSLFGARNVYASPTCFELSNGLLYSRPEGKCIQGRYGGRIVRSVDSKWIDHFAGN